MVFTTPSGADYTTCPLCGQNIDDNDSDNSAEIVNDNNTKIDDNNNNSEYCLYCNKYGIVFRDGCIHAMNGCTDSVYYAQLIYKVIINGEFVEGMPVFDSHKEFVEKYKSLNCQ